MFLKVSSGGVLQEYGTDHPLWHLISVLLLNCHCPLSPFLFITFMDRISRCNQVAKDGIFSGHRILSLLFTDDIVLLASSNSDIQLAMGQAKCKAARMRVGASKWLQELLPHVDERNSDDLDSSGPTFTPFLKALGHLLAFGSSPEVISSWSGCHS